MFESAARLAASIAIGHAFPDMNKRTALITMGVFLHIHGWEISPDPTSMAYAIEEIVIVDQLRKKNQLELRILELALSISNSVIPANDPHLQNRDRDEP